MRASVWLVTSRTGSVGELRRFAVIAEIMCEHSVSVSCLLGAVAPWLHMAAAMPPPNEYRRREPEKTALYRAIQQELASFTDYHESCGRYLPSFVKRTLEDFLECGVLECGFVRCRCSGCGFERFVGLSCRKRGLCPSCGGRRMSECAAHLVDRVLPLGPVRQWTLTLPVAIRAKLAYDHDLLGAVLAIFLRTTFSWMRRTAKHYLGLDTVEGLQCGSVSFIQRARDDLALSPHFHCLLSDGVFIEQGREEPPVFRAIPAPTKKDLQHITQLVWRRVKKLFKRRGILDDYGSTFAEEQPLLSGCSAASASNRVASGKRQGKRVRRIRTTPPTARLDRDVLAAEYNGFNLHAGTRVPAHDRKRLERLARYAARPPIANDRVELREDGVVIYRLKRTWEDGTMAIELSPHELLDRIVPLVPQPYRHQVRYHGALAPHANLRRFVIPVPKPTPANEDCEHGESSPGGWIPWGELIKRVFLDDVLCCPRCQGPMKILAVILNRESAKKILDHCRQSPPRQEPAGRRQQQLALPGVEAA